MNVVDTSAVLAVLFDEPERAALEPRLMAEPCVMSAATRVELGIVVEAKTGRGGTQLLEELLARIGLVVAAVDGPWPTRHSSAGADSARADTQPD